MNLLTAVEIAEAIDQPLVRVRHILSTRPITPARRAGMVRLYTDDVVEAVREASAAIDAKQAAATTGA